MTDLIKSVRSQKKLSQEDMAEALDVSANYISLIENKKKKPGMSFLKKFSEEYNVPLILLIKDELLPSGKTKKEVELREKFLTLLNQLEQSTYAEEK